MSKLFASIELTCPRAVESFFGDSLSGRSRETFLTLGNGEGCLGICCLLILDCRISQSLELEPRRLGC